MQKLFTTHLVLFSSIFLLNGCYFSNDQPTAPAGPVSFENDVIPIFTANCISTGCHVGNSPAGNLNLSVDDSDVDTVYAAVQTEINLADPESSTLLAKASNMISHSPGEILSTTSEEYQIILAWIDEGAENN